MLFVSQMKICEMITKASNGIGRHGDPGLVDASSRLPLLAMQFILVSSSYFSILELIWLEHMHSWKRRFTHGFQLIPFNFSLIQR